MAGFGGGGGFESSLEQLGCELLDGIRECLLARLQLLLVVSRELELLDLLLRIEKAIHID
eukprot:2775298-Pyramimonas_sp.AAC.1